MPSDPKNAAIADLNGRLDATPFIPFTIHMADGTKYRVVDPRHVTITRLLRRIEFEADEPAVQIHELAPLKIARIEADRCAR